MLSITVSRLLLTGILILGFTTILPAQKDKKSLTNQEIWASGTFRSESVSGLRSMNDGLHYTVIEGQDEERGIYKYEYTTGNKIGTIALEADLIPEDSTDAIKIASYQFSSDEKQLLISTNVERIYRHSTKADFYVYNIEDKSLKALAKGSKQRYATFSPNGKRVAYVQDNNLFVKDLPSTETLPITEDGTPNHVINGATDWVYEEEFAFDKAFFWSPDGQRIAYYKFNESLVKEFSMNMYGSLYPEPYRFKYPKAGEDNSMVSIWMFDVEGLHNRKIDLGNHYEYIPRIKWTNSPSYLSVIRMPRHQNILELVLVKSGTLETETVYRESCNTYIDVTDDLTFVGENEGFILTSEKSGFKHIYYFNIDGKGEQQITKGDWDVAEMIGVDTANSTVFYSSTEDSPLERHIYSIGIDGTGKKRLTPRAGFNQASFTSSFKYFINYHSDANTPTYISLHDNKGELVREMVTNDKLKATLADYQLSPKEFFSFTTSEGVSLNGWMIKPPNFNKKKKYPVLMFVYGGPGSQTVKNQWGGNYLWHQLVAQQGYLVVSVDNRGTGARGQQFKHATYKELGKLETIDQIETAKYLQKQPYVDGSRIGIWGWSYGGYMSSLCITKGADVFKTAVAVAPVTNWRFYDSIYTERYMQTPQENEDGYDDNSPINHVDKLKGNYLLIHGTADDNVHYQNAVEMVNALIKANKQFDLQIYPNRNHGIYGGNTRLHLFTLITDYILENI